MIENLRIEDIDATLGGQAFTSKAWRAFFKSMYGLLGVCVVIYAILFVDSLISPADYEPNESMIYLIACILFAGFIVAWVFICRYFNRSRKNLELWLQDAVLLKGKVQSLGEQLLVRGVAMRKGVAIEVEFFYNETRHKRQSAYKGKPLYQPVFRKYVNQVVSIAYSPKYDEVMLIKPKSLKKKHIYQKQEEKEETNA